MVDTLEVEARNAPLPDLVAMLKRQSDIRYDVVASAAGLAVRGGDLIVKGGAARITDDSVNTTDAVLRPTSIFDEGVSGRFDIPLRYVRLLRSRIASDILEAPAEHAQTLYDENVNYWLQAEPARRFLVRGFRTDDPDEIGIARALLSDRYRTIDNYDVLMATLDGVRRAGVDVDIDGADVSDRRMTVRITCPQVSEYAADLVSSYRSPFSGQTGMDNPMVFAGLVIKNSETGSGAFTIVPRLVIQVCNNGMQMTKDAIRAVHLGGRLDEGVVRWSDDTRRQELELITAKTSDAVATFLDVDYMREKVAYLRELAEIEVAEPSKAIKRIAKKVNWSEEEEEAIFGHFIKGGDLSALGIAQAVTAAAQQATSVDRQDELETSAMAAAELVGV
jgi:hypothetical protein